MGIVWLNGDFLDQGEARIHVTDRGFTLADGIFETIKAVGYAPLWLSEHFERLKAGAVEIGLDIPFGETRICDAIDRLLEGVTGEAASAIRLTVTRGPMAARGLFPNEKAAQPTCLLTIASSQTPASLDFVICRSTRRNEHSPLARIKSLNYGDNIVARREAIARGFDDAIMLNTNGHAACATVGNVFFKIDGTWLTPSRADGILSGLARRRFIAEIGAVESSIAVETILRSDAAFVCNSLGCSQIKSIDGRELPGQLDELPIRSVYTR